MKATWYGSRATNSKVNSKRGEGATGLLRQEQKQEQYQERGKNLQLRHVSLLRTRAWILMVESMGVAAPTVVAVQRYNRHP